MSCGNLNAQIPAYKKVLESGEVQKTYQALVAVLQTVRTEFKKSLKQEYSIAGVMHGYIDYTYFYLQNDFLKQHNLKFAIVLNHQKVCFEFWLLGQTKDVQRAWWEKFKATKWASNQPMPEYSILEIVISETPDFEQYAELQDKLLGEFTKYSEDLLTTLDSLNKGEL